MYIIHQNSHLLLFPGDEVQKNYLLCRNIDVIRIPNSVRTIRNLSLEVLKLSDRRHSDRHSQPLCQPRQRGKTRRGRAIASQSQAGHGTDARWNKGRSHAAHCEQAERITQHQHGVRRSLLILFSNETRQSPTAQHKSRLFRVENSEGVITGKREAIPPVLTTDARFLVTERPVEAVMRHLAA